ncbi:MAG TPA: sigma-70 family RNA polymerase sigma factor [Solirubrobacteraceae bacterium]|jgi:RNA polymerase sigma-70 factor (ECF subfamily)|nr:sigma-70 family RNA polymerase sigma factor [Solirubrobacteraceae bacterium]
MPAGAKVGVGERPVVYCLVPRHLAPKVFDLLRAHFSDDAGTEVVVECRSGERRLQENRRLESGPRPSAGERRRILHRRGRRVGARRAVEIAVEPPLLPRRARRYADQLTFVERIEPSAQELEDLDSGRVVTLIQAGDRESFSVIYMRYFDRVYTYLRIVFRDADDAEDATQQVFLKVFEGLPAFELRGGSFRGWLFVIARNHALNEIARTRPALISELVETGEPERGEPADESVLGWISDRELQMFIERMPLTQRQILFLRYVVDLSMKEISELLNLSPASARQQHSRALRFLRDRLAVLGRTGSRRGRVGSEVVMRVAPVLRLRRFVLVSAS